MLFLLLTHCLLLLVCGSSVFDPCFAMQYFCSSFAIIWIGKRELAALLCLSYWCFVTVVVLWLFHTVPRVGLTSVIVIFQIIFSYFFI